MQVDNNDALSLPTNDSRAILNWYRGNQAKWAGNVAAKDVEALVDSQSASVPAVPIPALGTPAKKRRLRLIKLEAHRFAGIHAYGTFDNALPKFVFGFREPITLFKGWNGAGKTSLVNSAVWCLTGQIICPQRPPEPCGSEFEGQFTRTISHINKVLWEDDVPYEVRPPDLISRDPQTPIPVEVSAPSFAQEARTTIFASLEDMDRLLAEGRDRPAVQEGLWLLESIVHAFQGMESDRGTVQGAYFIKIVEDLSRHHQGQVLQQALKWATQLHGFLSSPTGGGVRHGVICGLIWR